MYYLTPIRLRLYIQPKLIQQSNNDSETIYSILLYAVSISENEHFRYF